jgi:hypothetical protein
MPLPVPILDDRSYQQLRDELVRRIPVYAPEWTDHNASDPGITLIELFAFLGENLLYRFNQIPESTYLRYLRLLDIPLRPAQPASALLALTTKDVAGQLVPRGTEAKAGSVVYETKAEVHVWPLTVYALARSIAPSPTDPEQKAYSERAIDAIGELPSGQELVFYTNEPLSPDPAAPDARVVDFTNAVDKALWIAVVADDPATATAASMVGLTLTVGFMPDEQDLTMAEVDACPGDLGTSGAVQAAPPGPSVLWQVSTADKRDGTGGPVYETVTVASDTTSGLSRQGVITLRLPQDPLDLGVYNLPDPDIRGTGAFPPELDDDRLVVLFWIRATRRDDSSIGKVLWVGVNAAEVDQSRAAPPEYVGTGTGDADQRYTLTNTPVIDGSLILEVEEGGAWTAWTAVDGFQASAEDSRHYVIDLEAAEVRFGNGVQGRAPQLGERIRARSYRYGGGVVGNVPAKGISKLDGFSTVKCSNPLPASGGAEPETIEAALERVPGELRRRDRAVTHDDFRELALATPGASVGRAECLPLFYPKLPATTQAAGVVSVVVWPAEDRRHPNAPVPDRTLLRQVCQWLDARRLVTTELYVIPPTYRQIAVAIGVNVKPGYDVEAVSNWVELVVRQYLAPLPPYGPDGQGWPLGRRVYGPELEAAALQVEGVEFLEGLSVASANSDGTWSPAPAGVDLEIYEVPELTEITVVAGPPLQPGQAPAPPPTETVAVPVPTIKDQC